MTTPLRTVIRRGGPWLLLAGWVAFIAVGLSRAETNIEDFFPWLPDDTPARHNYMEFIQNFGADDVLIVSWEGCTLSNPAVSQLKDALMRRHADRVREVTIAEDLIARLTAPPQKMPRAEVLERISSILIGPDGETTCLFVHLTDAGMRDRRGTVERIIKQAGSTCGVGAGDLRLGGHPYVGYFSAEQTQKSVVWLSIPVAVISTILAWLCLRSRRLMVLVLTCGGMAALSALAMVPWAGYRVNGLLSALPSLVYVITTSGVIHVVTYSLAVRREDAESGRTRSTSEHARVVRRRAWRACLLSSASTSLGTLSLVWSDFPAIREFGMFGTASVLLTFVIHLGLLPLLLGWLFPDFSAHTRPSRLADRFSRLLEWLTRRRMGVLLAATGLSLLLVYPLFRLEGRFTLDRMFRPESEFVRNINWLERHVGPIDATEVLLSFDPAPGNRFFRRALAVQALEKQLKTVPGVVSAYSAVTFLPVRDNVQISDLKWERIALERRRRELFGQGHLAQTDWGETWRITLRSNLFGDTPRDQLMRDIQATLGETVASWETQPGIVYTGASEIFHETQQDVLFDFAQSLLLAYGLIFVLMTVAFRSLPAGGLSMLPNIVPCLTVFGLLGWIDRGIDIGMTVAGCIALGIAVDNTAHLLLLYRRSLQKHPVREAALRTTYRHSSSATFKTSVICGLSMLPYLFSEMQYLSRFGLVMSTLMLAAMFCDLLLTPALVASRAGRWFDSRVSLDQSPDEVRSISDESASVG